MSNGNQQILGPTPSLQDWLYVARLADRQANDDISGAVKYAGALFPVVAYTYLPNEQGQPGALMVEYETFNVISFTGTSNLQQVLLHALNALPVPSLYFPGNVGGYFQLVWGNAWDWVQRVLQRTPNPTFFIGHSLGGATAILTAAYALAQGYLVGGLVVEGCPNVGNATFAQNLFLRCPTLQAFYDPVALLPPEDAITLLLPSSVFGILPFRILKPTMLGGFSQQGQYWTLNIQGTIVEGFGNIYDGSAAALYAVLTGDYAHHLSADYARTIIQGAQCADKLAGAGGYQAPWILFNLDGPPDCGPLPPPTPPAPVLDPQSQYSINALACEKCRYPAWNPAWSS